MVKVKLTGINTVTKRLADGRTVKYFYHRNTGAPLPGPKGSDEFLKAYTQANTLEPRNANSVSGLIRDWVMSSRFNGTSKGRPIAESTKRGYLRTATILDQEFGKMPIKALEAPRVRGIFIDYQKKIGSDRKREADNRLTVLSLIFGHAKNMGKIQNNPIQNFDRIYWADRSDIIWTQADIQRFMDGAAIELQRAFILALFTGQRYGDLIHLKWSDYDGERLTLKQGKTGQRLEIPTHQALKTMLDDSPRNGPFILTRADGRPWHTPADDKALTKAFHARMEAAGFYPGGWDNMTKAQKQKCLRFNDIRGTTITQFAEAGATIPQICAITGHTLQSATGILQRYTSMTKILGESAIKVFENAPQTAFANQLQTSIAAKPASDAKMKGNQ